jgi:ADP-ribose pyrophosphatase YjhB (NUDIX family)
MKNTTLQVGVKILLQHNDKYLLLRRSEKYKDIEGLWDIPGGRIEPHEDLLGAISREIQEETGITLDFSHEAPKLLGAQDIFPKNKDIHVIRLTYTFAMDGDVPHVTLDHENTEYGWFTLQDMLHMEHIDPFLLEILQNSQENL